MLWLPVFIFILGLIIGSFLNVVILRMNTGRSVAKGRSACARCNATLSWYELIPVFSFLFLRGKCKTCKARISFQYALVELVTAIIFTTIYTNIILSTGFTLISLAVFIFSAAVASVLIVIFAYDIRHSIIPDHMVYLFIVLSLVSIVWKLCTVPGFQAGMAVVDGVAVALPFFLLWYFSKGRVMGFGDVKLALGMGWLLGLVGGMSAMLWAFWIGAVVGLLLLGLSRRYSMRSEIPFAPFLIIGTFMVSVWGVTILSLFQLWQ
ncbi:MAG: prepilin peptidase leader peptidase (prepilin peptidase) / N-methyltransferase [Candidatus Nomurabacteria bacterium]|nr:prepilin peptidase leader peptidase (prepilin peptidase) / N-methyltransferase [Candidatus Nomurabacteria bacterium]